MSAPALEQTSVACVKSEKTDVYHHYHILHGQKYAERQIVNTGAVIRVSNLLLPLTLDNETCLKYHSMDW